jgi:modification methylase
MSRLLGDDQDLQGTLFDHKGVAEPSPEVCGLGETFPTPMGDNTPEGLQALLASNAEFRTLPWRPPFDATTHTLHLGDARDLSWIPTEAVDLVVTSPPYWTLKQYQEDCEGQLGDIADYEEFLDELDKVWRECPRVLVGGGHICCVVGDVCIPRKKADAITSCLSMQIFW